MQLFSTNRTIITEVFLSKDIISMSDHCLCDQDVANMPGGDFLEFSAQLLPFAVQNIFNNQMTNDQVYSVYGTFILCFHCLSIENVSKMSRLKAFIVSLYIRHRHRYIHSNRLWGSVYVETSYEYSLCWDQREGQTFLELSVQSLSFASQFILTTKQLGITLIISR